MIAGLHVVGSGRPGNTKRWYIYAWRGGDPIGLRVGGPKPKSLTIAEVNAYHAAKAKADAKPTNTVSALIRDYASVPNGAVSPTLRSDNGRYGLVGSKTVGAKCRSMSCPISV